MKVITVFIDDAGLRLFASKTSLFEFYKKQGSKIFDSLNCEITQPCELHITENEYTCYNLVTENSLTEPKNQTLRVILADVL